MSRGARIGAGGVVAALVVVIGASGCRRERREVVPERIIAADPGAGTGAVTGSATVTGAGTGAITGSATVTGAGTGTGSGTGSGTGTVAGSDSVTGPVTGSASGTGSGSVTGTGSASLSVAGCALAATPWRFPAVPRLIALGDVHGDLQAVREVLRLAGVVDARGAWSGGKLWVVQTGDVLDRGDDEQAIVDWFEQLEREAAAAGGRFLWLLGNHELMNTAGDLRYVTPGGLRDFDDVPGLALDRFGALPVEARARVAAFAPGGPYAKIMAGQNYVAVVGDAAFVHGGIRPGWAAALDGDTLATRCWMMGTGPAPRALDDNAGPVWDRSFAREDVDCVRLDAALAELGVARMVIGHTSQESGINAACDGKVWRIDTGMARAYGGPRQALELTPGGARVLGAVP